MASRSRLLYNTNGLAHHRLDDAIDLVADLGFDGIALTPDVPHLDPFRAPAAEVSRIASHLAWRGMSVSIQTGARFALDPRRKHQPTLLDADPEAQARRLDFLVRCMDLGRDLGAEVISFWSGAAPGGEPSAELDDRLACECGRVIEAATLRGLRAALEPEPGMHIATVADWERLRTLMGALPLGLALDLGHVHGQREGDPIAIALKHRDVLFDLQIEDAREGEHVHLPFGEGTLDVRPTLSALEEAGWRGVISVELSRDSHRAVEVLTAAARYLKPPRR